MGLGGISIWQLLIILLIAVLIFGTKKLRSLGTDLGGAVRGFKKAVNDGEREEDSPKQIPHEGEDADFSAADKAKADQQAATK